ncbi:MAG: PorT family protein [Prevotella sp.]|nr:PorT family protein [Prevotella sp.]
MTKKDWTEQLREQLADYELRAPEGLWADIERRLPQQKNVVVNMWQRWTSVAALIALLFGIGWWLWPSQQPPSKQLAKTDDKQLVKTTNEQLAKTANEQFEKKREELSKAMTLKQQPQQEQVQQEVVQEEEQVQQELPQEEKVAQQELPKQAQTQKDVAPHPTLQDSPVSPAVKKRKTVSIGLMANNGLMAYRRTNGVQMSPEMARRFDFSDYLPTRSIASDEPIWLVGYEERQHHSHPISFGLTLSYPLTSHWTLSTGLVYTRLNSQFVNVLSYTPVTTEQHLDYVGVPLNVQYSVWKGKGWKAYASAGAQIDWNFNAKTNIEGVDVQSRYDHPQWSLGGSLGVEYDIVPLVGIYAEPGVRYYLKNNSKVKNFFKDQPFNWTLQIGIRLNLGKE